jgi:hypothetical protein
MNPENGGRIELRLGEVTSEAAEYEAHLKTPAGSFRGRAKVGPQVVFEAWTGDASEPPSWLVEDARAALKAALRTSQTEGRWPRRITRWRPEPER